MNIIVRNLSAQVTTTHLSNLFIRFGKVFSVTIEKDGRTGRSLGFGYVKMDPIAGLMAIQQLNYFNLMNQYMEVNEL
jgi:RNA recognition motif-containing protein